MEISDTINFHSSNPPGSINMAKRMGIWNFSLLSSYKHPNLELLLPAKDFVEGLVLNENVELGLLKEFTKLKSLSGLDSIKEPVDLGWFQNLERIAYTPSRFITGLEKCVKLKYLGIGSFNPKSHNFSEFPRLDALEKLVLVRSNIWDLTGISKYKSLVELDIYGAIQLKSCAELCELGENLEIVSFESCKKVQDFETLGKVKSLRKIILTNCGEIKSLSFVKELKKLDSISFVGTNVLDGDVNCCEGVGYIGFDEKRHYNRKMKDYQKSIK